MVLDLETRRAVRPEGAVGPELLQPAERVLAVSPGRLAAPAGGLERRLPICYADIDVNAHVNHAAYIAWMLEAVPEMTWRTCRLESLEVQFIAECLHGGAVVSRAAPESDGTFLHAVADAEEGRNLARARTRWKTR
jgi:acyl-ACP thioesterase